MPPPKSGWSRTISSESFQLSYRTSNDDLIPLTFDSTISLARAGDQQDQHADDAHDRAAHEERQAQPRRADGDHEHADEERERRGPRGRGHDGEGSRGRGRRVQARPEEADAQPLHGHERDDRHVRRVRPQVPRVGEGALLPAPAHDVRDVHVRPAGAERVDRGDERVEDGEPAADDPAEQEEPDPELAVGLAQQDGAGAEDDDDADRPVDVPEDAGAQVAAEQAGLERVRQGESPAEEHPEVAALDDRADAAHAPRAGRAASPR